MTAAENFPFYPIGYKRPINIEQEIERLTGSLAVTTDNMENLKARLALPDALTPEQWQTLITPLRNYGAVSEQENFTRETLLRAMYAARDKIDTIRHDYTRTRDLYANTVQKLAQLRRELNNRQIDTTPSVDKNTMESVLNTTKYYVPGSLQITGDKDTNDIYQKLYIRYSIQNVRMHIDYNPYGNINDGRPVTLTLPDQIHIELHPCEGRFRVTPDESRTQRDGWEHNVRPHPHIMDNKFPCLGGFESVIATLFADADIQSLFFVIEAFFEQANGHDSAGRNWPYWIERTQHRTIKQFSLRDCTCKQIPAYMIDPLGNITEYWQYHWENSWGDHITQIEDLTTLKIRDLERGAKLPDEAFDKSVIKFPANRNVFLFNHNLGE